MAISDLDVADLKSSDVEQLYQFVVIFIIFILTTKMHGIWTILVESENK